MGFHAQESGRRHSRDRSAPSLTGIGAIRGEAIGNPRHWRIAFPVRVLWGFMSRTLAAGRSAAGAAVAGQNWLSPGRGDRRSGLGGIGDHAQHSGQDDSRAWERSAAACPLGGHCPMYAAACNPPGTATAKGRGMPRLGVREEGDRRSGFLGFHAQDSGRGQIRDRSAVAGGNWCAPRRGDR